MTSFRKIHTPYFLKRRYTVHFGSTELASTKVTRNTPYLTLISIFEIFKISLKNNLLTTFCYLKIPIFPKRNRTSFKIFSSGTIFEVLLHSYCILTVFYTTVYHFLKSKAHQRTSLFKARSEDKRRTGKWEVQVLASYYLLFWPASKILMIHLTIRYRSCFLNTFSQDRSEKCSKLSEDQN